MKPMLLLIFLSIPAVSSAQISRQPEYINFLKAKDILNRAIKRSGLELDTLNIGITATGIIHESGHYATPEGRIDVPETLTLRMFSGIDNYFVDGQITYRNRNLTRQVYVKQDSIFYKDYFGRSAERGSLAQPLPLGNELLTLHPIMMLAVASRSLPSLRYLGKDGLLDLISFSTNNTTFTLQVTQSGEVSQSSYLATSNYYGDNSHRYEFLDYKTVGRYRVPTQFKEYEFGALRKEETFSYDFKPVRKLPVNQVCTDCLLVPEKDVKLETTIKSIGDGLYAVELNEYNNRSLFLVGNRSVTVFEAPVSYKAGQAVINAVKQTAAGKPITQVVVTHHHPDHAGGLRAFVEQGSTIITTKGNTSFFSRLVNYPHQLSDQSRTKILKPSYITVDSLRTFGADTNEPFTLYFTGDTQHTDEYLLVYFLKQKVLFHGDLSYFIEGKEFAASARDQAIARLINRYKLDVEKIYGSWPVKGYKEFGTKADLNRKLELTTK